MRREERRKRGHKKKQVVFCRVLCTSRAKYRTLVNLYQLLDIGVIAGGAGKELVRQRNFSRNGSNCGEA